MYDVNCMRCKEKVSQEFARFSNHCEKCLPLVTEKYEKTRREIDRLREEADDYAEGREA